MNNIKKALVFAAASGAATFAMATPVVSDVTMTQNNGRKVTITYKLSEDAVVTLNVLTNATPNAATGWASIGGAAICNAQGAVWRKVTSADADGNGNYLITWHPDQSWKDEFGNGFKVADGCAKAVVTAWSLDNTPNYMVVDISYAAQPNTQRYYPAVDFLPGGILGNPDYRTSSIVMRKIMAKDIEWTMGSTTAEKARNAAYEATHKVTLTNNYYFGVFPVTQSQWGEIATNSASVANFTADASMRPMEMVSYNEIRNTHNTSKNATSVPAGSIGVTPSSDSFLGLLRMKTGIDFDLPSEAQWEYAARAGHGSGYWNDGSAIKNTDHDSNFDRLGRYKENGGNSDQTGTLTPAEGGTQVVGFYDQNDWGIYDTCGNTWEWCLDWFEEDISAHNGRANIDPTDMSKTLSGNSGELRVFRGGSWNAKAGGCRPAIRNRNTPAKRDLVYGFRVICTAGLQ